MKRVWIIVLAAVLILAVVLLSLLIFVRTSPADVIDSGDSASAYPYSFQQTKNGLQIKISGPFPKNSIWTAESLGTGIAGVTEVRQNTRSAKFLLQPVSWGNTGIKFSLESEEPQDAGRLYELDVEVNVNTELEITVLNNTHRENLCILGQGEQYAYRILTNTDGSLELYADNDSLCKWKMRVTGECVAATQISDLFAEAEAEQKSETVQYHVSWLREGTDTLLLQSKSLGETVIVTVEAAADGTLTVADHQVTKEPVEEPSEYAEQEAAYRRLLGEPVLPEQATLTFANAVIWPSQADSGTYLDVGFLEFELNGKTWTLYGSDEATAEDFYAGLAAEAGAPDIIEYNGHKAEVYDHPDGAFAGWQSAFGRCWYLQCEGAGTLEVKTVLGKLLKVIE